MAESRRAIHSPISLNVESISPLPMTRELPPETEITVNLKMNRVIALAVRAEIDKQLALGVFVDSVAITFIGIR